MIRYAKFFFNFIKQETFADPDLMLPQLLKPVQSFVYSKGEKPTGIIIFKEYRSFL